MPCSLCGANNVNALTCPLNPNAKNPKPSKHNIVTSSGEQIKATLKSVATPTMKIRATPKAVAKQLYVPITTDPALLFPGDLAMQQEYEADVMSLTPAGREATRVVKLQKDRVQSHLASIKTNCEACHKAIQLRESIKDPLIWSKYATLCQTCHEEITKLYQSGLPTSKNGYASYHKGNTLPGATIVRNGGKNGFYNETMKTGAEQWQHTMTMRAIKSMPSPKK
jgi:hypothetical protein